MKIDESVHVWWSEIGGKSSCSCNWERLGIWSWPSMEKKWRGERERC